MSRAATGQSCAGKWAIISIPIGGCQNPCNQWVLIQLAIKCCSGSGVYILIPVTNLRDFRCEPVFRAEPNFLFRYAWNVEQANDFLERISSFYIHNSCVIKYMSYTYIRRIDTLHILKTDFTQEMHRDIKLIIYCTTFSMTIVHIWCLVGAQHKPTAKSHQPKMRLYRAVATRCVKSSSIRQCIFFFNRGGGHMARFIRD